MDTPNTGQDPNEQDKTAIAQQTLDELDNLLDEVSLSRQGVVDAIRWLVGYFKVDTDIPTISESVK